MPVRGGLVLEVLLEDGHVDLLDDVHEEAAVDALGEGVADVLRLVHVQGGDLERESRYLEDLYEFSSMKTKKAIPL